MDDAAALEAHFDGDQVGDAPASTGVRGRTGRRNAKQEIGGYSILALLTRWRSTSPPTTSSSALLGMDLEASHLGRFTTGSASVRRTPMPTSSCSAAVCAPALDLLRAMFEAIIAVASPSECFEMASDEEDASLDMRDDAAT